MMSDVFLLAGMFVASAAGAVTVLLIRKLIDDGIAATPRQPPEEAETVKDEVLTVQRWVDWNPWYLESEALRLEAQSIHVARRCTYPDEPLDENLAEVTVEMRTRHPDIAPTLN